jgi:hypothetical protein
MTAEFVGRMNPVPLKSMEQEFAGERAQFRVDEESRKLKRLGLLNMSKIEETRGPFEE